MLNLYRIMICLGTLQILHMNKYPFVISKTNIFEMSQSCYNIPNLFRHAHSFSFSVSLTLNLSLSI